MIVFSLFDLHLSSVHSHFLELFLWQDLDGVVLCVLASSGAVECSEANNILHTVRAITKCNGEIIVSIVHERYLEANTIVAAIIVFG